MKDLIFVPPESAGNWLGALSSGRECDERCYDLNDVALAAVWIPPRFNVALRAPTHDLVDELLAGRELTGASAS